MFKCKITKYHEAVLLTDFCNYSVSYDNNSSSLPEKKKKIRNVTWKKKNVIMKISMNIGKLLQKLFCRFDAFIQLFNLVFILLKLFVLKFS